MGEEESALTRKVEYWDSFPSHLKAFLIDVKLVNVAKLESLITPLIASGISENTTLPANLILSSILFSHIASSAFCKSNEKCYQS